MIAIRPHNDICPQGNVNCWKYVLVESLLIHWGTGTGTAQTQDVQVSPPCKGFGCTLPIVGNHIPADLGCSIKFWLQFGSNTLFLVFSIYSLYMELLICAEIPIIFNKLQLCPENHHWWWEIVCQWWRFGILDDTLLHSILSSTLSISLGIPHVVYIVHMMIAYFF